MGVGYRVGSCLYSTKFYQLSSYTNVCRIFIYIFISKISFIEIKMYITHFLSHSYYTADKL